VKAFGGAGLAGKEVRGPGHGGQEWTDPVDGRLGFEQGAEGEGSLVAGPCVEARFPAGAHQEEAFGRAGARDVEQSGLFADEIAALSMARQPARQAMIAALVWVGGHHGRADAVLGVEQPVALEILVVEAASQSGRHDHRKLESLALMHAQEAHAVAGSNGGGVHAIGGIGLRFEELNESEESVALEVVELPGESEESVEVGSFGFGTFLAEQPGFVAGFSQDGFEAGGEGTLGRDAPPTGVGFEESGGFGTGRDEHGTELGIGGRGDGCRVGGG